MTSVVPDIGHNQLVLVLGRLAPAIPGNWKAVPGMREPAIAIGSREAGTARRPASAFRQAPECRHRSGPGNDLARKAGVGRLSLFARPRKAGPQIPDEAEIEILSPITRSVVFSDASSERRNRAA